MSQIKERPILFSAPMVRAILESRKTVTRRPVKATKAHADGLMMLDHGNGWWPYNAFGDFTSDHEGMEYPIACPYGKPGDRLWVREAWAEINVAQAPGESWVVYRECDNRTDYGGPWKPSIHMRRRDSRILLEITAVRVERLQNITQDQAMAEGIEKHPGGGHHVEEGKHHWASPIDSFAGLWSSVGGNWDANPWVWVVEFKRVTP